MALRLLKFTIDFVITIFMILYSIIEATVKFFIPNRFRRKSVFDQIVLITGAGSGIGASLAVRFAKRKCRLILWDINIEGLKSTVEKCRDYQSESLIYIFQVDVSNRSQVMDTAQKIKSDIGFVDILINNAGIVIGKGIMELDEKSISKTFNVNIISHFWMVQAFLPEMLSRNKGHIVSVASLAGLVGINQLSDYCASKFAAIGFQESLFNEIKMLSKTGIKLLTVCPFFINTGLFNGVNSECPLLPMLETEDVTAKIEEAILIDSYFLIIPRIANILLPLKYMIPLKGYLYLTNVLKVNNYMSSFSDKRQ